MNTGLQINSFFKDIAKSKIFWTIQFEDGEYIKWNNEDGSEVFPLWSTESRVKLTLKRIDEFDGGKPISISLNSFINEWLQDLNESNIAIGPNWSGENLTGTTFEVVELIERIKCTKGFHG